MATTATGARTAVCALLLLALAAAAARAGPPSGPHETVVIAGTTDLANASTGFLYAARYHAAGNPNGGPPPLRHLIIRLPPGIRIDTSVVPRCTASDMEIMLAGESACPAASRIGSGQATARSPGLGTATYDTVIYNGDAQQLELVESGGRVVSVVHTYIHGTTLDGPVPTCITGGQPPSGCRFDEVTLLANHLSIGAITTARGNYSTMPPSCPASGHWQGAIALYYADGSVDHVPLSQPCRPARGARHPRRRPARHRACRRSRARRCSRHRR